MTTERRSVEPGRVRVTLLVDNERAVPGVRAQWGFAAWVEKAGARVLLDSGANTLVARNAAALGVPLAAANAVVLSHGHGDHGGGLPQVTAAAPDARLVLHPGALVPRYWLGRTGKVDPIGLPGPALAALRAAAARATWAVGPVEVAPGVWASGPVARREHLEEPERNFFLDRDCTVRDHVVDDQALWTSTASGLVIVLGCAHAGVVNTLAAVREAAADVAANAAAAAAGRRLPLAVDGLPRVRAVIGGMHLLHAGPARLDATCDALERAGVGLVAPVHCTGKRGKDRLRDRFGDAFVTAGAGSVLDLD